MSSGERIDAGIAMIEAGLHDQRAATEMAKSRLARIAAADALEKAGRYEEAAKVLAEVEAEQK